MSNPLTKYVAAAGLAGALAFGGFTVASAQDSGSTTTQPGATTEAPAPGTAPQGDRTDGAGCDHDKGTDGGGTTDTPSETPAPSSSSSSATNTAT